DQSLLELIAARLDAPAVPWQPAAMSPYVARIAARILGGQLGAYANLEPLISELKSMDVTPSALQNVMRWVAPYWLSPQASGRLAAVIYGLWKQQQGGWVAVNGQRVASYTARMLMFRALPFDFKCRVAKIEDGTDHPDAEYYTHEICAWLRMLEFGDDKLFAG